MRFIAAIDTKIYGSSYAQGSDVDITGWTRRQILQFLDNGIIAPSHLSVGAVQDALEFRGAQGIEIQQVSAIDRSIITVSMTPQDLAWLTDVDVDGAGDGSVLLYDGESGQWKPGAVSFDPKLNELQDVDPTGVQDGWTLHWSGVEGVWRVGPPGALNINDLEDVDTSAAQDGHALIYDFSSGTWVTGQASSVPGPTGPVAWAEVVPWSAAVQYVMGPPASVVTYDGSTYVARASSVNKRPDINAASWRLIAAKGDKGSKGDVGPASTIPGPPGPANVLTIGTVIDADVAAATITGTAPAQVLSLELPKGPKGDQGAGASAMDEITDVDLADLADGYVLVYDEGTATWVSVDPESGPVNHDSWSFSSAGELEVYTGKHRLYNDSGKTRTITKVRAAAGGPPVGSGMEIDVLKNGTSIFPTTPKPIIPSTEYTAVAVPDTVSWSDGEYLSVSVLSIGSSAPGEDLTVTISTQE